MDYKKPLKSFGVTTVEQLVNEGIGDVAMKSIAAKRPQIFGIDTYVLGNLVGGLVIGAVVPTVYKKDDEIKRAAQIVGAGLFAKGLIQLAKQYTAPTAPTGLVRAAPVPMAIPMNGSLAAAPSMF